MEHEPFTPHEDEETLTPEVVEAVVVIERAAEIEPVRAGLPPRVQAAAAMATGFVAGAATAAVLSRRRAQGGAAPLRGTLGAPRGLGRLPAARLDAYQPSGPTQTFLVHVQALARRS